MGGVLMNECVRACVCSSRSLGVSRELRMLHVFTGSNEFVFPGRP